MIENIEHGDILEIHMARPPANALNRGLVDALAAAHAQAIADSARAIVLSGLAGMFSGGVDVPELLEQDRNAVEDFWTAFLGLMKTLAASPVPVAAAITGQKA